MLLLLLILILCFGGFGSPYIWNNHVPLLGGGRFSFVSSTSNSFSLSFVGAELKL